MMNSTVVETPELIQVIPAECAVAALSIILAYYDRPVALEELAIACGVSETSNGAGNLMRVARQYGLKAQAVCLPFLPVSFRFSVLPCSFTIAPAWLSWLAGWYLQRRPSPSWPVSWKFVTSATWWNYRGGFRARYCSSLTVLPNFVWPGRRDELSFTGPGDLAIRNGPLILKDVSLHIYPGEFVALVGASGSGKSTLSRLLLGFETPEAGAIYYDGQDLTSLDIREVRRQMGVVLQNGRLLAGSIFENIVGSSALTLDDAWEAARMSGLDEDIKQMPLGMHTLLSEGGGTLSGGQRQRLLIARAIVNKPRIIFFDEATSALDNRTQAIVSESLERLEATRVVIAHRLSTIIHADRIFVIDNGQIMQSGRYEELITQPGLFAELAKRQIA